MRGCSKTYAKLPPLIFEAENGLKGRSARRYGFAMHDTRFGAGDVVQWPQQAVQVAHVLQHKPGDKTVLTRNDNAIHDLWNVA